MTEKTLYVNRDRDQLLDYQEVFLKSRGLSKYDFVPCELCGSPMDHVHHIHGSFRGTRQHSEDGSDVMALCRSCHDFVHSKNSDDMKKRLLRIVHGILLIVEMKKNGELIQTF